nr:integrase, catalytic region, zinc finger, CCHC-type, peptidase aspartic, catalytic [Tanacetum cinerariifolium]
MKAELQAKVTTIEKLKANIKRLNNTSTINSVKKDIDEIETINIELEHRVTKLIVENEHLKQTYKQLYDSIKPSRVQAKEHAKSLVNQLNHKSVEITDLNAQLQEKVIVITALKNNLRKFKGKDIVDNAAQVSNNTTIAPGMYKLDRVTLAPKDKNNRETYIYYLKHTMEQAVILKEIVEQAKPLNPLDRASYSACKYVKLIQELLGYVRDTCTDIHKPSKKRSQVVQIFLWYLDSGCSKHMTGDRFQLTNFVHKFLGTVKFGNDQITKMMGKPDLSYLHVFGALCYPNNDSEYLGKLLAKADIGLGVLLSRGMGFLRSTLAVVVILVKGNTFPTIVKVLPVGCDPLALVGRVTPVEDNIGLLEIMFDEDNVLMGLFPDEVTGSINLTFLLLFIGVTAISLSPKLWIQGQTTVLYFLELFPFDPDVYVLDVPMKLVVEIECVGMNADEFDKETGSSDGLQPEQADLNCVHALNEPHLHEIHVFP